MINGMHARLYHMINIVSRLGTYHSVHLAARHCTCRSRSGCTVIYPCTASLFTALYHFDTMAFKNAQSYTKSTEVETLFESICTRIIWRISQSVP